MPRCDFTRRALADLRNIARYTGETWGRKQALHYLEELKLRFQKFALSPEAGRVRDDIAPSVHSFPVARHVAFHVRSESGITVLRVLHPSMDVARTFLDDES